MHEGRVDPSDLLAEVIRDLLVLRDQQASRLEMLLSELRPQGESIPLSSEGIVTLIRQHLASPHVARLPVLVVAAAYTVAAHRLGERVRPLSGHNAEDRQTGSLGDIEITVADDDNVVTCYEMKDKRIVRDDIDNALGKVRSSIHDGKRIDNYIFITTMLIDRDVLEYTRTLYEQTGGIEFAILDCLEFLRHFLHLFHRLRLDFLQTYQDLMLAEPTSAVSQPLKEAFLALRRAAENQIADT